MRFGIFFILKNIVNRDTGGTRSCRSAQVRPAKEAPFNRGNRSQQAAARGGGTTHTARPPGAKRLFIATCWTLRSRSLLYPNGQNNLFCLFHVRRRFVGTPGKIKRPVLPTVPGEPKKKKKNHSGSAITFTKITAQYGKILEDGDRPALCRTPSSDKVKSESL